MYEGQKVRLRELRPEDAAVCRAWVSEPETARQIYGGGAMPFTMAEEEDFISKHAGHRDRENHFAAETRDGQLIGVCSYSDVNWKDRSAVLGWFIGDPEQRDRGYGTDLIRTLLKICFDELNLHRVSLQAFQYNERAIRLYDRLGFVREGALRQVEFAMGRRWDAVCFSMLEDEYRRLEESAHV